MSAAPGAPSAAIASIKLVRPVWTGDRATLRPLVEAEVTEAYAAGLNHPDVARFVEAAKRERQTVETVTAFVRANAADPASVLFGIHVDGALRGTVRLHDATPTGEAWVGIALFDRSAWGRGVASGALSLLAAKAGDLLSLRLLRAGIDPANEGSRRAFAKAGFRLAGLRTLAGGGAAETWERRCAAPERDA